MLARFNSLFLQTEGGLLRAQGEAQKAYEEWIDECPCVSNNTQKHWTPRKAV